MAHLPNIEGPGGTAGRASGDASRAAQPVSARLRDTLHRQDVTGERAIATAQGAVALFVLALHMVAQLRSGLQGNPWVVLTLSALAVSSLIRLRITRSSELPER